LHKKDSVAKLLAELEEMYFTSSKENLAFLEEIGEQPISDKVLYINLIGRSSFDTDKLQKLLPATKEMDEETRELILTECKYYHYIKKQQKQIEKMNSYINVKIPDDFVYDGLAGLSLEIVEKLKKTKPATLFAASQISGVTPAAIDVILMYVKLLKK
ncbi:MAG TPA: tRNA uridine-5-carboxymethylaminomethyl(34) synthesis enzyme MnmG, partial [Campylobacterales bacterium]|nr:tRNA uridine-5-carboxymethylaminomethyl(34) synthesis enzyme MnmG [Campylobacterales bacterium]